MNRSIAAGSPPAIEPPALDPRELGQGEDQLGLGLSPRELLEPGQRGLGIAPEPALQVVAVERVLGPLAGPVDAGHARA